MKATLRSKIILNVILLMGLGSFLQAHDPGLSSLSVQVFPERLEVTATFAPEDLLWLSSLGSDSTSGNGGAAELLVQSGQLDELAQRIVRIQAEADELRPNDVQARRIRLPQNDNIEFRLSFVNSEPGLLQLTSLLLRELPKGHRQLFDLKTSNGALLDEQLLSLTQASVVIDRANQPESGATVRTGVRFLLLGVEHIWAGYDHLLFLIGLLVVSWQFLPAVRIITAFTVAHSLTLALAAMGWVRLPPGLVEPLIAASVIYVGIQNLRTQKPDHRWLLTFGFGLIHGLGFAGALQELVAGRSENLLVPLLSFNLGVELGQLAVAAAVLPLLTLLARRPVYLKWSTAAISGVLVLAGSVWLFERVL